jgi:N-dimethylarginine dimethylaminohydrolase
MVMDKILVCKPDYYDVFYSINPWMRPKEVFTDTKLAVQQWHNLVDLISLIGAEVVEMSGQPGLPDMVFTANAGVVFENKKVVLANFACPERRPERDWYKKWFEDNGYEIVDVISPDLFFEGAGDALFKDQNNNHIYPNKLYFGYGFRSDYVAVTLGRWSSVWREHTQYLQLVDPYFYHLDTCFCPLSSDYALIYPEAFDRDTFHSLQSSLQLLCVPKEDALQFACNAVVVGNKVIIPSGCSATRKLLTNSGFEVFDTDMSEFIKSGGACKCLTLRI